VWRSRSHLNVREFAKVASILFCPQNGGICVSDIGPKSRPCADTDTFFAFAPLKVKDAICNPVVMSVLLSVCPSVCNKPRSRVSYQQTKQTQRFLATGI